MVKMIDLRSDTITLPTEEMREAMKSADVGDDVYREDPTVIKLEELAAKKMGKEAGLFVVSGTMANLIAIMTHTTPGDEVIVEQDAHIYYYEVGGMARIGGVMPRLVKGERVGIITPDDINKVLRPPNIHFPDTTLLALENTHNRGGGIVIPNKLMQELYNFAKERGLSVHLDGARIFNAAVAQGIDVKEIAKYSDSVMFCFSKGLSAPLGSVLVGSKSFIEKARKNRKIVGGGMRQAGVVAIAGIIALEKMVDRLKEDHENAKILRQGISEIDGMYVDSDGLFTNIVVVNVKRDDMTADEIVGKLKEKNILALTTGPNTIRFVIHRHIKKDDILYTINVMREVTNG